MQTHMAAANQNRVSHCGRCDKLLSSLHGFWSNSMDSTARLGVNTTEHSSAVEMEFISF